MLYFKAMPNSIDFYKEIFLHVIPVHILVRCSEILKSSASIHESSGSQLFKTTTGIQLRPVVFDESRFIMTFLTILGVTQILFIFRLVL